MDLTLSLVGSGLKFCKEDLNIAVIRFSPLQNLKWLYIKYNYTEHLPKVLFGKFICGNKVFHFKTAFILIQNASDEGYMSPIVYFE